MGICSLERMDALTCFLKGLPGVRAIMAFGSLAELDRFDDYSDLDFLIVCSPKRRAALLRNVRVFEALAPIAFAGIEGEDAVKLLFADGVVCDFGIVTEDQLPKILHGPGRFVWKEASFCERYIASQTMIKPFSQDDAWCGHVLMDIYVGLLREMRAERAAAMEKIQFEAVRRLLGGAQPCDPQAASDPFSPFRRAEKRGMQGKCFEEIMPGYAHNLSAAKSIIGRLPYKACPADLLSAVLRLIADIEESCRLCVPERTPAAAKG